MSPSTAANGPGEPPRDATPVGESPPRPAVATTPRVIPAEERPPVARGLGLWWLLAAGAALALAFVATDHLLWGALALGVALAGAALGRAVIPFERAGGLVVRSRPADVALLVVLAAAVLGSGFSLDLSPR